MHRGLRPTLGLYASSSTTNLPIASGSMPAASRTNPFPPSCYNTICTADSPNWQCPQRLAGGQNAL